MKAIHFLITDELNQQIEQAILQLGISVKSEFFRVLALQYIKENAIASRPLEAKPVPIVDLTPDEKIIFDALQAKSKTIDDLVDETRLSVSKISSLLTYLLLKNQVTQEGRYFKIQSPSTTGRGR